MLVIAILFLWLGHAAFMALARRGGAAARPWSRSRQVLGDFWAYQLGLLPVRDRRAGAGRVLGARRLPAARPGALLRAFRVPLRVRADRVRDPWWLLLLLPLAALRLGAAGVRHRLVVFRQRGESGPYFALITLALALLAYQLANNWESVTGGFNGLKGIPGLPGLDSYAATSTSPRPRSPPPSPPCRLTLAPLGVLWAALAQNERRVGLRLRHHAPESRRLRRERRARRHRWRDLRAQQGL